MIQWYRIDYQCHAESAAQRAVLITGEAFAIIYAALQFFVGDGNLVSPILCGFVAIMFGPALLLGRGWQTNGHGESPLRQRMVVGIWLTAMLLALATSYLHWYGALAIGTIALVIAGVSLGISKLLHSAVAGFTFSRGKAALVQNLKPDYERSDDGQCRTAEEGKAEEGSGIGLVPALHPDEPGYEESYDH